MLATLAGAYRLSKRQIQQLANDVLGLTISTGMISKLERQSAQALAEPYRALAESVLEAEAVNIDETGWREDRRKAWLWVTMTAMATVFTIAGRRTAKVAQSLLGDKEDQVVRLRMQVIIERRTEDHAMSDITQANTLVHVDEH